MGRNVKEQKYRTCDMFPSKCYKDFTLKIKRGDLNGADGVVTEPVGGKRGLEPPDVTIGPTI